MNWMELFAFCGIGSAIGGVIYLVLRGITWLMFND